MTIRTEVSQFLEELGLNKVEISSYFAALELGSGSASAIASLAGLNRITAYEALKRLSRKGFVLIRVKRSDRTRYFVPVDVSVLQEKLKEKKKAIEHAIKRSETLKGELRARFSLEEEKPVVLFYEGEEGIREVLHDSLRQKPKEIISFASLEAVREGFTLDVAQKYWDKRVSLGIPSRGIIQKTPEAMQTFSPEKNKRELRDIRFLSPELYHFKNEIDVYGDCVGITSAEKGNMHGIIIRSRSIAQSMHAVFEALWGLSEGST